ncbi:MAG: hypothetical protein HYS56_04295 [Candidatus Omnitrophica bacterium]|nr:hypothetical protein [Candidatus Omnitrophota bacterium]
MKQTFKMICAVALALGLAYPAFAEVQNVKVSGDITTRSFYKSNFDLKDATSGNVANGTADDNSFTASFTHVGINADLTDNVSAEVGLSNQRLWAYEGTTAGAGDIDLYSSYVTLKEFFYSPLTVTVGLQPLKFGNGFIVGPGLLADPSGGISSGTAANGDGGNNVAVGGSAAGAGVGFQGAREYSLLNNFSAIRGTLDFNPLTIDLIAAKVSETVKNNADATLWGANLGYKFGSLNAEAEAYWFWKDDEAWNQTFPTPTGQTNGRNYEENEVHTIGLRGSLEPISRLNLSAEIAHQTGEIRDKVQDGGPAQGTYPYSRDRKAWGSDVAGEYAFDTVYAPTLGLGWTWYSGEEIPSATDNNNEDFEAWDPVYTSLFRGGAIGSFLGGFHGQGLYGTQDPNDTAAGTNRQLLRVFTSAKPLDSLKAELSWIRAWFDEKPLAGRDDHAGDEVDFQLTYDYTEDVKLGLLTAWFLPGNYYDGQTTAANKSNDTASEIAGTVSVVF